MSRDGDSEFVLVSWVQGGGRAPWRRGRYYRTADGDSKLNSGNAECGDPVKWPHGDNQEEPAT
jgi:hypothetical protein